MCFVFFLPQGVAILAGHGRGNLGVDEPMAAVDIVVVTARANTIDEEGADALDGGKVANRGGRHGGGGGGGG